MMMMMIIIIIIMPQWCAIDDDDVRRIGGLSPTICGIFLSVNGAWAAWPNEIATRLHIMDDCKVDGSNPGGQVTSRRTSWEGS